MIHPSAGTVVTLEGDLVELYRAAGWSDADQQEQAPSEKPDDEDKPAQRARRSRKN